MGIKTDIVVIGAGSAGLSALRQVQKFTDSYVMIDPGPLGTTCARVGCMPSKVLISVAKDFHRRHGFPVRGIEGGEGLSCNIPVVMKHVRSLRDRFAAGMEKSTLKLAGKKLIKGRASFVSPTEVQVGSELYEAKRVVIAAGSHPAIPRAWMPFRDRILTSEDIFEQQDLPQKIGIIGLGAIGLELGQALSRLGLEIAGFDMAESIGGLTDPAVNSSALDILGRELPLYVGEAAEVEPEGDGLRVTAGKTGLHVDKIIASLGVIPNTEGLGLENLGIELNDRGLPPFNPLTMQVADLPVYIGGDINGCRPILHEALDEGFIAGQNAGQDASDCFCRRTSLRIVFSDPSIVGVGSAFSKLNPGSFVTGKSDFSSQSRAMVEGRNAGLLHIYADKQTTRLLGAEMIVPDGEHLGHTLSQAVQQELTVSEVLQMPFYHPTIEEGLRSALRDAAVKSADKYKPGELTLCGSCPEDPVC
ncbi:MAG: dihydrolipoyl dehydrogenase [Acidobacteriota bacterium]